MVSSLEDLTYESSWVHSSLDTVVLLWLIGLYTFAKEIILSLLNLVLFHLKGLYFNISTFLFHVVLFLIAEFIHTQI